MKELILGFLGERREVVARATCGCEEWEHRRQPNMLIIKRFPSFLHWLQVPHLSSHESLMLILEISLNSSTPPFSDEDTEPWVPNVMKTAFPYSQSRAHTSSSHCLKLGVGREKKHEILKHRDMEENLLSKCLVQYSCINS